MSSSCARKYDVFISFRGEDGRTTFISHLRSALSRDNIKAYADDDDLQKGEEIWPSLCQAIKLSQLAIVVFSENYAESKWCLKELVEILHCRKTQGLVLIPVFYQVDPSHVRKCSGSYGEAIAKHEDNESVQDWKTALTEAANISGWDSRSRDYKNESQVIEKILEDVSEKLNLRSPIELNVEDLVEIEKHCGQIKLLLSKNEKYQLQKNVHAVGIWGMGGIGKTTIAKALFSELFPQYDAVCFLANVREESKRIGLISLCDKLLFDLLKEGHHKYNLAGSTDIMRRLSNKKVFFVLDDVDSFDQLDVLCRQCNYVGPDSKLIITTRNRHLLRGRVDDRYVYDVNPWSYAKSLELFCLHAFKERHPKKGFEDLSERAVTYAGGVPLALKVLGSNLYSRSTEFWDSELSKLRNCPNDKIQNVLQVSYDGLDDLQKKIFLDIAFFFKGEHKDDVIRILDACGFCATSGVKVLEDKALITISYPGTIQMHDLIQEMGLNIVRGVSEDPGKRSRLRDIEEVSDILENKKGSDVVQGIKLDLSSIEDLRLNADIFNTMTNLRILRLYVPSGKRSGNVHHSGILSKMSGKLRYLEWSGCRLKSLPVTFCAKMLVEICMPHSHVTKLWQGVQDVVNLVRIDLSECKDLKNLPDLSKASKLKWVNLSGCESLCDIHPSVFSFDTLETLILDGCKKLKSLKSEKHLTSLEKISVNGCTSLMEFSVSSDSITSLDLSGTGIEMLDSSIGHLRNLKSLNVHGLRRGNIPNELSLLEDLEELRICNCRVAIDKQKLHVLFAGLTSLRLLHLKDCCNLCELPDNISGLSKLYELRLDSSCLKTLPASIRHLISLKTLSLENCRKLESLPELPPNVIEFNAVNCRSLKTVSTLTTAGLQVLHLKDCCNLCELPDNIDSLSRLYELRLYGSCVKTLPASIKHLRNLEILSLENCSKLGSLPELPPTVKEFNAVNCRSLGTVSTLTTFVVNMIGQGKFISFKNCVGLNESSLHCIMEGAHLVTSSAVWQNIFVKGYGANTEIYNYKFVKVCFPGSRVPGQFKHRTADSSITIDLPSSQTDFVGLTLCVVLSPSRGMKNLAAKIWCQCYLANGTKLGLATMWYHKAVTGLNSDHVFVWCDSSHFDSILKVYDTGERRVTFEFYITNDIGERVTIGARKCGVCLIFDSEEDLRRPIRELYVRFYGLDQLESQHSATSMETETSDEYDCNDINNHERDLSEQCSCSCDCLFDVLRYLWRLISI